MSCRTAAQVGLEVTDCDKLPIRLATGVMVYSTSVVRAQVSFGIGIVHEIEFRVVPELSVGVILGMPWLRERNPSIDWALGTVSLGDGAPVLWCQSAVR